MVKYFKKLFGLSERGAKDLVKASFACAATNIALMLSIGILVQLLSQTVPFLMQGGALTLNVALYIVLGIVVLAVIFVCSYIQYNCTYIASYTESANRRVHLAEKLRKLPLSFFGQRDLADLTTTLMTDVAGIEHSFSHYVPEFVGAAVSTLIVSIGMICYEWRMGLALVWVIPTAFLIVFLTKRFQDTAGRVSKVSKLDCSDGIQECIDNIRDIKAYHLMDSRVAIMGEKFARYEKISIKGELTVGVSVVSAQMLLRLGIATTAVVGAALLVKGEVSLLQFIVFMMAATRVFDPVAGAFTNLAAMFNSLLQAERMKDVENHPIQTGSETASFDHFDIVFDHVKFAYNTGETVLDDVSFTANQGEVTALVGPSGGGKSTATKLAARFWDVTEGKISLGGVDISTVDPEALLKNYSIVFQDVTLFNNTVMENIRIGKMDATDDEVYAAAKAAQCEEFIHRLPNGYQTDIGENGATLSGGERQRLSIARALLKDAPVILLDEATASLDVDNETLIQTALSRLIKNKTVLIIAHRMRTVAGADKVVVLSEGHVAQQGSPQELMQQGGVYRRMVELQEQSSDWKIK